MANLTLTAASVVPGSGAKTSYGFAGTTITAGQVVYLDATTNTYKLASNNSGTAAARAPNGIALNGASAGQPLAVQTGGPITVNAVLTAGVAYYLSSTGGAICPVADLTTGMYPSILGIAVSTTVLNVEIQQSGVAL